MACLDAPLRSIPLAGLEVGVALTDEFAVGPVAVVPATRRAAPP